MFGSADLCPADRDLRLRLDRIKRDAEDAEAARARREAAEKARTTH
ncbi:MULTISPECIES: hypothetical protein [unclassified Streptomyces]|nr:MULTISPECIES: hypothetical protein [unclassified Streptomyces]